ncbi:MAG: hypothetical protein IKO76_06705 [Butyrivibrio sp.]|nr:hypothetical protein [Butyrivibrio sp.]
MERGSKERLERHNKLESDIEKLLKEDGVDILMAQTTLQLLLGRIEEDMKDYLAHKEAKEILHT